MGVAEQSFNGNYTPLYAPPKLLRLHNSSSAAPPGAPHDIWALGVMFQQLMTATCQSTPWFVPDPASLAAVQDEAERMDALHSAVAAQHAVWVGSAQSSQAAVLV